MLVDSVAATDGIFSSESYDPWSALGKRSEFETVSELQACNGDVILRLRTSRDSNARKFGTQGLSAGPSGACTARGFQMVGRKDWLGTYLFPNELSLCPVLLEVPLLGVENNGTNR